MKKAYVISAIILKGGSGKSFMIYMLMEYLKEKFYKTTSNVSKNINNVLVCDLDSQISLLGRIQNFQLDRRTVLFLEQKSLGEKIKIKYQAPDEHDLYKYDLILLDNSPEYRFLFTDSKMINNTDMFIIPVNTVSSFVKVEDTIKAIRDKELEGNISKIIIVFNDTMHIDKKASNAIISMCKQITNKYSNVCFWGSIQHSKKVSLAEITNKPIYNVLRNTACGKDNRRFSKGIINTVIDNRKEISNE